MCGDLTSAFNFKTPNAVAVPLPSTAAYVPPNQARHPSYVPAVPAKQALPKQEAGLRFARALPYAFHVTGSLDMADGVLALHFANAGTVGAVFQVRSGNPSLGPWTYTVGAGRHLADSWNTALSAGLYDLEVHAPNGFLRTFKGGTMAGNSANLASSLAYDTKRVGVTLTVTNHGAECALRVVDTYTGAATTQVLEAGATFTTYVPLAALYGWYDLVLSVDTDAGFAQRLCGHVETGHDSATDPAIGGVGRAA